MAFQNRNAHLLLRAVFKPKSPQSWSCTRSLFSNRPVQHELRASASLLPKSLQANFFTNRAPFHQRSNIIDLLQKRYISRKPAPAPKRGPLPEQNTPPQPNFDPTQYDMIRMNHERQIRMRYLFGEWIVRVLVATCFIVFALKIHLIPTPKFITSDINKFLDKNFTLSQHNVDMGRWWTYITCTFNHGGIIHLIFNMAALWTFRMPAIAMFGPQGILLLYLTGAVGGSFATLQLKKKEENKLVRYNGYIGASASILSITTALAIFFPQMPCQIMLVPIDIPIWAVTLGFAAWSLFAESNNWLDVVGHSGHLGGIASGAAVALFFKMRRRPPRF